MVTMSICIYIIYLFLILHESKATNSALSGTYIHRNEIIYVQKSDNRYIRCSLERCLPFQRQYALIQEYDLAELVVTSNHSKYGSENECLSLCKQHSPRNPNQSDTLVVFTTCNHLDMTLVSLRALSSSPDSFDLIVVDDHSIDGTPEILIKKVIINP